MYKHMPAAHSEQRNEQYSVSCRCDGAHRIGDYSEIDHSVPTKCASASYQRFYRIQTLDSDIRDAHHARSYRICWTNDLNDSVAGDLLRRCQ